MEISDDLLCVFSAKIDKQNGSYTIEIPKQEVTQGPIQRDEVYRTAMLATPAAATDTDTPPADVAQDTSDAHQGQETSGPPVDSGDIRDVEIEDIGDQGDGIARVERGYVIIVSDVDLGDRVTIEITKVQENVAFAEPISKPKSS